MKIIRYILFGMFLTTFSLYSSSSPKVVNSSVKISVIFNTLCAKCHEGECSGRLSFDMGSKATSNHIKRYAGDINITKGETEEFFSLLNYMKTQCALWMPQSGDWKSKDLLHFALPSAKGYFISLGFLKEGIYHMEIKLKDDTAFRIEILSDHFEHFLDIPTSTDNQKKILKFTVLKSADTFLRIQSRKALEIMDLKIKKVK